MSFQPNFAERPAPPNSVVRPFVPVAGIALRNAEQYQQATVPKQTLSSQLYPVSSCNNLVALNFRYHKIIKLYNTVVNTITNTIFFSLTGK